MSYKNINSKKLKELLNKENILLLDVRTKEEYEEKNIQNSINIQLNELLYGIDELNDYKDKKVVVYCRSGKRSITACNVLYINGFKNLYNLEKGIIDYIL